MKKVNLRDLYPDVYKTDAFLEVTDEVQAVFQSDERAEAAHERQMYRYTDLLIEKVYVFPDNRIEIVYKVHDLFE